MHEKKCVKVIFILAFLVCNFMSAKAFAADTKQTDNTKEVIIVFKTHFDIGYTEMAEDVVHRYRTSMIDNALRVCDANNDLPDGQRFVWTIPGWPMSKIIEDWPGQTPDRKQRLEQAFKDGRFVVHALPFTTHTESLELEDLVRGLSFASQISRSYGFGLPKDAKMTDVPSHSWILPTLLKHAGIDFLHLGCNAASSSPDVPKLFWWEGPDGSRLLTMYTSEDYGTPLLPPNDWPHKTWLALIHTGDNQGPPNPEQVKQLLAEVNQKMPGVKVRIGRLSDFGDAIISEKPQLPVVRGDMPDTWIHGPMSDPIGWKTARNIRPLINASEALNTHMKFWGIPVRDINSEISKAYEQSLLYGEHTWGASIGWIDCKLAFGEEWTRLRQEGRYKRSEASWDEHTSYINSARDIIEPILEEHLQFLAKAVNVEGRRIVVYNPLPWLRDGLVTVKMKDHNITALKATDSRQITSVESNSNEIRFLAARIPAGGYRTFIPANVEAGPVPLRADRQSATIESPYFKAKLDNTRGIILSLIDKRTGRELIDASAQHGFGQYLYERFDKSNIDKFITDYVKVNFPWTVDFQKPGIPSAQDVPYRSTSPNNFTLRFEQTPVSVTAVMDASAGDVPHSVTTRLTLYRELPYADLELELHDKPMDPWPEGGWICLPLKVDKPNFRLGRLGSIIDPHRDIIAGTNHHLLCLNSGMSVLDNDGTGIGLCPVDSPLVSLQEPGLWRYSRQFKPTRPVVYVNLFNNQWSTNFRLWNGGTWSSRVRLWSIDNFDADRSLVTPSMETRSPLLATSFDGPAGSLLPTNEGLKLSCTGVAVTAFGPNPDGKGLILRLWEQAGKESRCIITLPKELKAQTVQPCDLRGRTVGKLIPIENGRFETIILPNAPSSFVLIPLRVVNSRE